MFTEYLFPNDEVRTEAWARPLVADFDESWRAIVLVSRHPPQSHRVF